MDLGFCVSYFWSKKELKCEISVASGPSEHAMEHPQLKENVECVHVDPQIREQEFGNFQDPGLTSKAGHAPGIQSPIQMSAWTVRYGLRSRGWDDFTTGPSTLLLQLVLQADHFW